MSRSTINDLQGDLLSDSGLGGLDMLHVIELSLGISLPLSALLLTTIGGASTFFVIFFLVKKHQTIVIANRTLNH